MILTKSVTIIGNPKIMTHYNNLGYTMKVGEPIEIKIEDLTPRSRALVEVRCDICSTIKIIKFQKYTQNITNNPEYPIYCCSHKCANEKRRLTTLSKYGVNYTIQNQECIEKGLKTCIEKYGTIYPSTNKEVREKINTTIFERYGVDNVSKSDVIKEKKKNTFLKNFGVENNMQVKESFEKQQKSAKLLKTHTQTGLTYRGTFECDFLDKFYDKVKIENCKSIPYTHKNKNKIYHPDFILPELNLIIEIKNNYLYNKFLDQNLAKKEACIESGYNYLFIIDKDYSGLEILI